MKRFYDRVEVAQADGGWQVQLDGRGLKTVKGAAQLVPTRALADALASEWAEQGEDVDTSRFVLRDLADYAIDMVEPDRAAAIAQLIGFAETDTLCYRADPDEPLHARQLEKWEPLLGQLEDGEKLRFTRVSGIIHRPQPPATIERLGEILASQDSFTLAAMQTMASLAASLSIALIALRRDAEPVSLWRAANLEEEWQADLWGRDPQAEARRARRQDEFLAAFRFVRLLRE